MESLALRPSAATTPHKKQRFRPVRLLAPFAILAAGCFAAGFLLAHALAAKSPLAPVPAEPTGVVIRAYPPQYSPPSPFPLVYKPVRVRGAGRVAQLVVDLNKSTLPEPGRITACPAGSGARVILRFLYPNNDRWSVHVDDMGCLTVSVHGTTWTTFANGDSLIDDLSRLLVAGS